MLRNPAYAGTAVFGKTMATSGTPGLNRVARLQGRPVPRAVKTAARPREEWLEIPVPAIVDQATFARVRQRLEDNKRFAARNTKVPSLLQGLAACSACGYGYYRTSTRTTNKKIYYYRCLGSDDYRYEGGRVCGNQPVRADYLDTVVWDHITAVLADPALIRAEISKRLEQARTADPAKQVLSGSLTEQTRRCGKPGCRCAGGQPDGPYAFFAPKAAARGRLRYVPASLAGVVRRYLRNGEEIEQLLAEISAINKHTESTRSQYGLAETAAGLGWPSTSIEVIDTDLGISGKWGVAREGFTELWRACRRSGCCRGGVLWPRGSAAPR